MALFLSTTRRVFVVDPYLSQMRNHNCFLAKKLLADPGWRVCLGLALNILFRILLVPAFIVILKA